MKGKKKWFIFGAVALVIALGVTVFILFSHAGPDSLTLGEARSQAASLGGQPITVRGIITPGSIIQDSRSMRFALSDGKGERLNVVYEGILPGKFKPGTEVVVKGMFLPDGGFEALAFPTRSLCTLCHGS